MTRHKPLTREAFVQAVRSIVLPLLPEEERAPLANAKLMYGVGQSGTRGVTYFNAWNNGTGKVCAVEICAMSEESPVQLAGTTIHELAHVLAGAGAGHDKEWKAACARLGLRNAMAAGHTYRLASFSPRIRVALANLFVLADGSPSFGLFHGAGITKGPRPCGAGIGTRGGKSRGAGSGSRLRLWECACAPAVKVRVARDDFDATCNVCSESFQQR
jgi:hypothetical protein